MDTMIRPGGPEQPPIPEPAEVAVLDDESQPFQVPDLRRLDTNEQSRSESQVVTLQGPEGEPIQATITVTRNEDLDQLRESNPYGTPYATPVKIRIVGESPSGEQLYGISGFLFRDDQDTSWRIHYRMVEPEARRRGYSQFGIQLFERVVQQLARQYPELAAPELQIETQLPALARSVMSQDWLAAHQLAEYRHATANRSDLGYTPASPEDAERLRELLMRPEYQVTSIYERTNVPSPKVVLVKPLR